tara:strand:+ start:492 stop:887 length:396 start_codon:yes stop_codon:yes gene_type:complete
MKLTKSKLKQLIKEELKAVLNELDPTGPDSVPKRVSPPNVPLSPIGPLIDAGVDKIEKIVKDYFDEYVVPEIENIVDERIAMHGNLTEQMSDGRTLESVDQMARQNKLNLDWISPAVVTVAKKLNIGLGET